MLTKLLTIRMVARSRSGFSSRRATFSSLGLREERKVSILDLERENSAVSEPDIRAETMNNRMSRRM